MRGETLRVWVDDGVREFEPSGGTLLPFPFLIFCFTVDRAPETYFWCTEAGWSSLREVYTDPSLRFDLPDAVVNREQ